MIHSNPQAIVKLVIVVIGLQPTTLTTIRSTATYQQRYLINNTWWCGPECPIFLYAGNEGFIELFANNTGRSSFEVRARRR